MKIQLTYDEILGYVEEKFHVKPTVEAVDRKTLRIMYQKNRFMPTISVNVHVDSVSKDLIRLSYDCSSIVNGLLSGVVWRIEDKIPSHQVEVNTGDKQVLVHLDAFEELEKVLALVEPTDITFGNEGAELKLLLRC